MTKPQSQTQTLKRWSSPAHLTGRVEKRICAYALAAGATGVSLLALTQPSEGEIIYTPIHHSMDNDTTYFLDLDNDGRTDFTVVISGDRHTTSTVFDYMWAHPVSGNGVQEVRILGRAFAAALKAGDQIPAGSFYTASHAPMVSVIESPGGGDIHGMWPDASGRYLGLKFKIEGATHYGWLRLSVQAATIPLDIRAMLTGYAYETVANRSILAGQTCETDISSATPDRPSSGSLGSLALGSTRQAH